MNQDQNVEKQLESFYDGQGWSKDDSGHSTDAALWEDLRPVAEDYVAHCRRKLLPHLPRSGISLLDAASGPVQYPEYLEYSAGFQKRICVDISEKALSQAKAKLGNKGTYLKCSLLELPLESGSIDATISLHTIYHIDAAFQEKAVRELIRVTKPGAPIVVLYANPDRLLARLKRLLTGSSRPNPETASAGIIYYYAYPLNWWRRFEDECELKILPWRFLTAQDARRFVPNNWVGKKILSLVAVLESMLPSLATSFGAYPMIIFRKK